MKRTFNKKTIFVLSQFNGDCQSWYITTEKKLKQSLKKGELDDQELIVYPAKIFETKVKSTLTIHEMVK